MGKNRKIGEVLASGEIEKVRIEKEFEVDTLGLHTDINGDDAGMHISDGQFSVGTMSKGYESVFGGGDSYPVQVAYHVKFSELSANTTFSGTNITDALQSDSGSTVGFFGGTTVGKTLLIGSDYPTSGVKLKIISALSAGTGTADYQYIYSASTSNVPMLSNMAYMSTNANAPYDQYGAKLLNHDDSSEQVRWGISPYKKPEKLTLTINSVSIEKYWYLINITSAITADAVIEQVKMHTSRTEINADGRLEFFDDARRQKFLNVTQVENDNGTPKHQNIAISSGMTGVYLNNKFEDSVIDSTILMVKIPEGLDTSVPLIINIDYYGSKTGDAGENLNLNIESVAINDTFVFDGNALAYNSQSKIIDMSSSIINTKLSQSFILPVSNLLPNDTVAIRLYRKPTTPTPTNYDGDIILVTAHVSGYFWK